MNRRTLITKLAGTLCALPLIGQLFKRNAVAAPSNPEIEIFCDQRKAWHSPYISLSALQARPDETLRCVTLLITDGVRQMLKDCHRDGCPIKEVSIHWRNIPDSKTNPNCDHGFFCVSATRRAPFKG